MGWNKGMQNITIYQNQDGRTFDLIFEYGQIDHQTLKAACEDFVMETGIRGQQRVAQNNKQMWRCINNSLTKQAKAKVLSYCNDYEINNNRVKKIAAPLLYKTIMHLAALDSNATDCQLCANLRELTSYAIRENGNIDKIYTYFDQNFTQLKACKQNIDNVHCILFIAYLAIPNAEFNTYMHCLYDNWMDQVGEMKNIKFEQLMQHAKAKYDLLLSMGKWGIKTKEQEEIIALKAQLEGMKDAALQISDKLKKAAGKKTDQIKKAPKGKIKRDLKGKKDQKQDETWKKIPPKQGKPLTKKVGKKKWHWCKHHMAYTVHKPADCCLSKDQANKANMHAKAAIKEEDDDSTNCVKALLASINAADNDNVE